MGRINWPLTVAVTIMFALLFFLYSAPVAFPQEHHHPPADEAIHQKFYKNWMMPDNRGVSCCHDEDCSPAESRFENGQWIARKVGDEGDFTPVPLGKIEYDRDTPDGRSHICGRRLPFLGNKLSVFCFIVGAGG